MTNPADNPGNQDGSKPVQPLEPGRPDVMPNPPPDGENPVTEDSDKPAHPDEAALEEDMSDVDANNSISEEHPPQR